MRTLGAASLTWRRFRQSNAHRLLERHVAHAFVGAALRRDLEIYRTSGRVLGRDGETRFDESRLRAARRASLHGNKWRGREPREPLQKTPPCPRGAAARLIVQKMFSAMPAYSRAIHRDQGRSPPVRRPAQLCGEEFRRCRIGRPADGPRACRVVLQRRAVQQRHDICGRSPDGRLSHGSRQRAARQVHRPALLSVTSVAEDNTHPRLDFP